MDLSAVFVALFEFFKGFDPLVAVASLATLGMGVLWIRSVARYDAMVAQKDARFDAAVDALNKQVAELNRDYATANKDTAEIVNQVAQTLATLAANLKG